ncbi:MAG: rhomboid family intramembrane serine protease [Acidimicrobiales bacterium]
MPNVAEAQVERPRLTAQEVRPYLAVLGMVAAMWLLEVIDLVPGVDLDRWGIRPRTAGGLIGIPLAPFLHAGFGHLIGNTIPFLVLGLIIAASGLQRFVQVTVIVGVFAGVGVWLTAPAGTVHIGASGLVFGYLTYLIARGFFARRLGQILFAFVILFFYGGLFWGLLPHPGISWQGHVFGAIGGVVAAWVIHADRGRASDGPAAVPPAQ